MHDSPYDPNSSDFNEMTALHLAVIGGHVSVAASLLAGKADVEAVNNDGMTPSVLAKRKGKQDFVDLFAGWQKFVAPPAADFWAGDPPAARPVPSPKAPFGTTKMPATQTQLSWGELLVSVGTSSTPLSGGLACKVIACCGDVEEAREVERHRRLHSALLNGPAGGTLWEDLMVECDPLVEDDNGTSALGYAFDRHSVDEMFSAVVRRGSDPTPKLRHALSVLESSLSGRRSEGVVQRYLAREELAAVAGQLRSHLPNQPVYPSEPELVAVLERIVAEPKQTRQILERGLKVSVPVSEEMWGALGRATDADARVAAADAAHKAINSLVSTASQVPSHDVDYAAITNALSGLCTVLPTLQEDSALRAETSRVVKDAAISLHVAAGKACVDQHRHAEAFRVLRARPKMKTEVPGFRHPPPCGGWGWAHRFDLPAAYRALRAVGMPAAEAACTLLDAIKNCISYPAVVRQAKLFQRVHCWWLHRYCREARSKVEAGVEKCLKWCLNNNPHVEAGGNLVFVPMVSEDALWARAQVLGRKDTTECAALAAGVADIHKAVLTLQTAKVVLRLLDALDRATWEDQDCLVAGVYNGFSEQVASPVAGCREIVVWLLVALPDSGTAVPHLVELHVRQRDMEAAMAPARVVRDLVCGLWDRLKEEVKEEQAKLGADWRVVLIRPQGWGHGFAVDDKCAVTSITKDWPWAGEVQVGWILRKVAGVPVAPATVNSQLELARHRETYTITFQLPSLAPAPPTHARVPSSRVLQLTRQENEQFGLVLRRSALGVEIKEISEAGVVWRLVQDGMVLAVGDLLLRVDDQVAPAAMGQRLQEAAEVEIEVFPRASAAPPRRPAPRVARARLPDATRPKPRGKRIDPFPDNILGSTDRPRCKAKMVTPRRGVDRLVGPYTDHLRM
mmetsp:Transcript_35770/g.93637  ORF Transcript_35770/g.93637 Transcript_35770/m.93637 type:complete len:907 (+) Transcript_35770:227-2947(+)